MILTKVIKHSFDLSKELAMAKLVAEFAINNRDKLTTKHIKSIGLKSAIANQILRKYGKNKKCKSANNVNLIIPNQSLKFNKEEMYVIVVPLKIKLDLSYFPEITKINQIEISNDKAFVSYSVKEMSERTTTGWLGVDCNATGHIVVAADLDSGLVLKFGKLANHFRRKYRGRKKCGNFMKNLDHKISRALVDYAYLNNCSIVFEDLKGIRPKKSKGKKLNGILHSWSFYRLRKFVEYKAKLLGVPVLYIEPHYTSQICSRCGNLGMRDKKQFKCSCGHVDHADANAAFNIGQLAADRDVVKRCTDTPPLEPHML